MRPVRYRAVELNGPFAVQIVGERICAVLRARAEFESVWCVHRDRRGVFHGSSARTPSADVQLRCLVDAYGAAALEFVYGGDVDLSAVVESDLEFPAFEVRCRRRTVLHQLSVESSRTPCIVWIDIGYLVRRHAFPSFFLDQSSKVSSFRIFSVYLSCQRSGLRKLL